MSDLLSVYFCPGSVKPEHVYASVNYSNKSKRGDKHVSISDTNRGSHGDICGVADEQQERQENGKALSREFSFSEPNIAVITDEISLDGDEYPPLPNRNYRG